METNGAIRDAIHFRWHVTGAFLAMFVAGVVVAAGGLVGKTIHPWLALGSVGLCVVALMVQWWWQGRYHGSLCRLIATATSLSDDLAGLLPPGSKLRLPTLTTVADAEEGLHGIRLVSVLAVIGACMLIVHAGFWAVDERGSLHVEPRHAGP